MHSEGNDEISYAISYYSIRQGHKLLVYAALVERKVTMQDEGEVGVCVAKEILK